MSRAIARCLFFLSSVVDAVFDMGSGFDFGSLLIFLTECERRSGNCEFSIRVYVQLTSYTGIQTMETCLFRHVTVFSENG